MVFINTTKRVWALFMPRLSALALVITVFATNTAPLGATPYSPIAAAPPSVTRIPPLTVPAGQPFHYVVNSSFPQQGLFYTATQADGSPLPFWMKIDGNAGALTTEAPMSTLGQLYHLTVKATDKLGRSSTASFYLTVDSYTPDCRIDANTDRIAKVIDCETGSVQLRGHCSSGNYSWSGPAGFTSTEAEPVVTVPGTYFLYSDSRSNQRCHRVGIVEVIAGPADCPSASARNLLPRGEIVADRTEGTERLTVQFDGTNSADKDGRVIGYRWSWDQGVATGPRPQITFPEGEHEVILTITDDTGARSTDRIGITVDPRPQHTSYWLEAECASVGANWEVVSSTSAAGGSYLNPLLNASRAAPADAPKNYVRFTLRDAAEANFKLHARIHAASNEKDSYWVRVNGGKWYAWKSGIRAGRSFYWNEMPQEIALTYGDNTIDIAYRERDTRLDKIYLTATNKKPYGHGETGQNCHQNLPPLAVALATETSLTAPALIALDGSQSSDPDGQIVSYDWSWDGGTARGVSPRITLPAGDHRIVLTVTDDEGATHQDVTVVSVVAPNVAPVAVAATSTTFGTAPLSLRLDAGASYDPDGHIVHYSWKWNGGTAEGKTAQVTLPQGNYRFELTVTDEQGATHSELAYVQVEPAPTLEATGDYWLEAECAQLGASWSTHTASGASNGQYVEVSEGNAYNAPRGDAPEHLARFTLSVPAAGRYELFARIDAPTNLDDSYWVRINGGSWIKWYSGLRQGEGFQWNRFPRQLSLLTGTNTIDFALREDGTRLDKLYLTSSTYEPAGQGEPATNCSFQTSFEAECAAAGSGWERGQESGASNGSYLEFTGDRQMSAPRTDHAADQLRFHVEVPTTATHYLHVRLDAPDPGRNSLWIRVDDGAWIKFWEEIGGAQLLTDGFEWRTVNRDGKQLSFELTAGAHTITVANRESRTRLDKLLLSTLPTAPTGMGVEASNCSDAPRSMSVPGMDWMALSDSPSHKEAVAVAEDALSVYPNPTYGRLNLELTSDYRGVVDAIVSDVNGRRLITRQFTKEEQWLGGAIDVSSLPPGVYLLRLSEGAGQKVLQFISR